MELIRGIHNLRSKHQGCVATIGKFDGVHLGHREILSQLITKAKELSLPSLVILFEPHPAEYFLKEAAPARLSTLVDKLKLLEEQGIDRVLCLNFGSALCDIPATDFITALLVNKLSIAHFVVGDDFRFGQDRLGSFSMLQAYGDKLGFGVENTSTYQLDKQRVSSTWLRDSLAKNDFQLAASLCGREYSMMGRVMYGQALARTFGVPTANIKTGRYVLPLRGVYAVTATLGNKVYNAVANIGMRPTVSGVVPVLEAHLFEFQGDLYGEKLIVTFKKFIRSEQKFADLDQLKQAILNDVTVAKQYFAALK